MEVHLRRLEMKDADGMYEWMTDPDITCFFRFDSSSVTLEKCRSFISHAYDDPRTMHYAIADENDEYLGTISLKNITEKDAEYAISTRKKVHGTGAAYQATKNILDIAFKKLGLSKVYLNVINDNYRAIAFYKKCGFTLMDKRNTIQVNERVKELSWFYIEASSYF